MPLPILAVATAVLPYLPTIGKAVLGWLPPNATAVVNKVIGTVQQGLAITQPVINTLSAIADNSGHVEGPAQQSPDIPVSQMVAAIAEMNSPGAYETAMTEAKATPMG